MALALKTEKRQKQQVTKSPRLIKAIGLHEKSNHEVEETMDQELDLVTAEERSLEERYDQATSQGETDRIEEESVPEATADGRVNSHTDWDDYYPNDDAGPAERQEQDRQKEMEIPPHERVPFRLIHDLQSHLMWQLMLSKLNVVQKEIAVHIIGNLNEAGCLENSIEEIRQDLQRYEPETWLETLKIVQNFDPVGVAARDLKECLLIQARSKGLKGTIVETIIETHWDDLLHKRCGVIARSLSVPVSEVHAAISVISNFDPRPINRYYKNILGCDDAWLHIQPGVYVYKEGDNYKIEAEDRHTSKRNKILAIKKRVHNMLRSDKVCTHDAKVFLQGDIERLEFRLKSIDRRHETIRRIGESIVRLQREYFETGSMARLRPLVAREVAEEVGLDESTVRRAYKNKYMQTPHGVFEFQFFFDKGGVSRIDGGQVSSKAVKELIRDIVQLEKQEKPYTDQEIAFELRTGFGIEADRRVIAKYRESIGISSATLRKWPY